MATAPLRYHGLVSGSSDPHDAQRGPRLQILTSRGVLREVPMTERDLIRLIRSAAGALERLERERV